jgi:hypothetical protein
MKLQPNVLDLQWEFTWLTGRSLRQGLLILFAVVIFVLLIACVNVANLLLGRAVKRQKELSLRAAIGASRSQLIRQLLTESSVLSLGEHVWEYSLRFSAYGMWARKKRPASAWQSSFRQLAGTDFHGCAGDCDQHRVRSCPRMESVADRSE